MENVIFLDNISKESQKPPDKKTLKKARVEANRHKRMIEAIYKIIAYFFYLSILVAAANTSKDHNAFLFHKSLSDILEADFEEVRNCPNEKNLPIMCIP